jgi:hypothetical protein
VAGLGDQPKKGSPRLEALTRGFGNEYYLARRYFNYSIEEWDQLPWWQTATYMNGLIEQGILKSDDAPETGPNRTGSAAPLVDYAEGKIPPGFRTRSAG